jgi:mannose-1-phosphate guanylyltransferase/mannose-6-phosphate isomerase
LAAGRNYNLFYCRVLSGIAKSARQYGGSVHSDLKVSDMPTYPVILSGGSGTRLWPLSTPECPKQFLPLVTGHTMMQETALRVSDAASFAAPIIVSSDRHGALVADQIAAIGRPASAVLVEPEGRNTAAAIAMAAHWIVANHDDALMLVMPSDHVIADQAAFHAAIARASSAAQAGFLVTFGIQPTHAETGYGYIEKGAELADHGGVHVISEFVEKPHRELAEAYLAGGRHYWNGGIFLFTARTYLAALARYAPQIADAIDRAMQGAARDGIIVAPDRKAFLSSPNISVDNAVMELADRRAVTLVDMGWSDVGSWDALWAIRDQDDDGNAVNGPVLSIDSAGNLLYVDGGPPIAALGIRDSVIISTTQAVLVMPRDRSQDVKQIVEEIKAGRLPSQG